MNEEQLREYRCPCGKLLFKAKLREGSVEIKCKGCRRIVEFHSHPELQQDMLAVA